jgi:hypothetical protein
LPQAAPLYSKSTLLRTRKTLTATPKLRGASAGRRKPHCRTPPIGARPVRRDPEDGQSPSHPIRLRTAEPLAAPTRAPHRMPSRDRRSMACDLEFLHRTPTLALQKSCRRARSFQPRPTCGPTQDRPTRPARHRAFWQRSPCRVSPLPYQTRLCADMHIDRICAHRASREGVNPA